MDTPSEGSVASQEGKATTSQPAAPITAPPINPIPLPSFKVTPKGDLNPSRAFPAVPTMGSGQDSAMNQPQCILNAETLCNLPERKPCGPLHPGNPHLFAWVTPARWEAKANSFEESTSYHQHQAMEASSTGFSIGLSGLSLGFVHASSSAQLSEQASAWVGWYFSGNALVGWDKMCVFCEANVPSPKEKSEMFGILTRFMLDHNLTSEQRVKLELSGLQLQSQSREQFGISTLEATAEYNRSAADRVPVQASAPTLDAEMTFLDGLQLRHLEQTFKDNRIQLNQLKYLTFEDLKDMGIKPGECRMLLANAQNV